MNIKITKVENTGKSLNNAGEDFDLELNNRFYVQVCALISDINREEFDIELIALNGQYVESEIKLKYEDLIYDAIEQYANDNEDKYRQSPQEWYEFYTEHTREY